MVDSLSLFWKKHESEIISVAKGAIIASIGAGVTAGISELGNIDFGAYTPIVVAVNSVLVNMVRKFGIPVAVIIFKGSSL